MINKDNFDHLLGVENDGLGEEDIKIYQKIIQAHAEEQSVETQRLVQYISLKLRMEDYLKSDESEIKSAGYFLEKLLEIYNISKTDFAEYIGIERTNFYALLKGRRKFNNSLAAKAGMIFSIDPQLWLFIEAKNEMKLYHKNHVFEDSVSYCLEGLLSESGRNE